MAGALEPLRPTQAAPNEVTSYLTDHPASGQHNDVNVALTDGDHPHDVWSIQESSRLPERSARTIFDHVLFAAAGEHNPITEPHTRERPRATIQ